MTEQRERRLVFGEDADLYDRARPSYPTKLVDQVVGLVGTPARALDVGCGTGKALRLLAGRGLTGVGVEAHPAMAEVARRRLTSRPGWRVDVAPFEDWEPQAGDAPFDLVTSAQAWHWIDPDIRFRKAHDLLRPGGWLALWWNVSEKETSPLDRAIAEVYERVAPDLEGGLPKINGPGRGGEWDDTPPGISFEAPVRRDHRWTQTYTTAEWLDLLRTHSNHRLLPPERLDPLLRAVGDVIDAHGGRYRHRYVARLWAARRAA